MNSITIFNWLLSEEERLILEMCEHLGPGQEVERERLHRGLEALKKGQEAMREYLSMIG